MRRLILAVSLGTATMALAVVPSEAAPGGFANVAGLSNAPLVRAQLQCNYSRCLDPRSGAYTQSGCDWRGCYPISGVVGYTNPATAWGGYGYGSDYYPRHRRHHDWRWGDD